MMLQRIKLMPEYNYHLVSHLDELEKVVIFLKGETAGIN
jgi:hypothetical protein